jgi:hypothetical protein
MKKEIYSFKFRFVAFIALLSFTTMSCSLLNAPEPKEQEEPEKPPAKPKNPSLPTMFYLTENYEVSPNDTNRTGFFESGEPDLASFLTIAEELPDQRIAVRFMNVAKSQTISLYFSSLTASFPNTIVMNMGASAEMTGTFGSYNENTETFSLTLSLGEQSESVEGLVMNKSVLTMYQDDPQYTPSQNARIRDYLVALAVWVPIQQWFAEMLAQSSVSASRGFIPRNTI